MHTKKTTNLGISLMGGNAVGIYVHDVQKNSIADLAGLKKGDQILEYNGVDLRRVTAESAATEISKPADNVTVLVQHNMTSKLCATHSIRFCVLLNIAFVSSHRIQSNQR